MKTYWITKTKKVKISEMDSFYIRNCLRILKRKLANGRLNYFDIEDTEKYIVSFETELESRQNSLMKSVEVDYSEMYWNK